jgi:hypothetical protein
VLRRGSEEAEPALWLAKKSGILKHCKASGVEILKRLETGVEIRIWHFYGVKTLSHKWKLCFLVPLSLHAFLSISSDPERISNILPKHPPFLIQMHITTTNIPHGEGAIFWPTTRAIFISHPAVPDPHRPQKSSRIASTYSPLHGLPPCSTHSRSVKIPSAYSLPKPPNHSHTSII